MANRFAIPGPFEERLVRGVELPTVVLNIILPLLTVFMAKPPLSVEQKLILAPVAVEFPVSKTGLENVSVPIVVIFAPRRTRPPVIRVRLLDCAGLNDNEILILPAELLPIVNVDAVILLISALLRPRFDISSAPPRLMLLPDVFG